MHQMVFQRFEEICRRRQAGGRVLEVGAVPSTDSLLNLKALEQSALKIGVNLAGPAKSGDFLILPLNANSMCCFRDNTFDTVLCNAMLEHDPFFWRSLAELYRVAKPGGLVVIGVPAFHRHGAWDYLSWSHRLPWIGRKLEKFSASARTLRYHAAPGDYYRFSPQAVREVFMEGMTDVESHLIMDPPRIIAAGKKRNA